MRALDGPCFFRLAHRVAAYPGVMAIRIQQQQSDEQPSPGRDEPGVQRVESTPAALALVAGDVFEL